jgi:hypothetical protein
LGLARTNGRTSNRHQRLAAIAGELEPTRPPHWIDQPSGRYPSQGWWWTPQGLEHPAFLGHNHIAAEVSLRALLDAHYKP